MTRAGGVRRLTIGAVSTIVAIAAWHAPSVTAQTVTPAKALHGIGEQLPGLPSRYWNDVLANGDRLPDTERLVVVATDGRMLDIIDGAEASVDIPEQFDPMLRDGSLQVVLAHNHPMNTSLSGADLSLLAKPGVQRVVALGNDGSLYEASAGWRADTLTALPILYPIIEARVLKRIPVEAGHAGVPTNAGFDNASHLIASVLDRAGFIQYRSRMSVSRTAVYVDQGTWLNRVIDSESRRLIEEVDPHR